MNSRHWSDLCIGDPGQGRLVSYRQVVGTGLFRSKVRKLRERCSWSSLYKQEGLIRKGAHFTLSNTIVEDLWVRQSVVSGWMIRKLLWLSASVSIKFLSYLQPIPHHKMSFLSTQCNWRTGEQSLLLALINSTNKTSLPGQCRKSRRVSIFSRTNQLWNRNAGNIFYSFQHILCVLHIDAEWNQCSMKITQCSTWH